MQKFQQNSSLLIFSNCCHYWLGWFSWVRLRLFQAVWSHEIKAIPFCSKSIYCWSICTKFSLTVSAHILIGWPYFWRHPSHILANNKIYVNSCGVRWRVCPDQRRRHYVIVLMRVVFERVDTTCAFLFAQRARKIYLRHDWSKDDSFLITSILIGNISQPYRKIEGMIAIGRQTFVLVVISLLHKAFINQKNAFIAAVIQVV